MAFDSVAAAEALLGAMKNSGAEVEGYPGEAVAARDSTLLGVLSRNLQRTYAVGFSTAAGQVSELEESVARLESDLAASESALADATREADAANAALRRIRAEAQAAIRTVRAKGGPDEGQG